ncbi:hypothetical protein [Muricoccus nepalensis]|uniref:hypothetical protein n=1 Tax=Muricoccus nepalensis TaxID=1854500 RepID=UPI00112D7EFF|nr:hypothetical protein [Roseomonas nepalensis]
MHERIECGAGARALVGASGGDGMQERGFRGRVPAPGPGPLADWGWLLLFLLLVLATQLGSLRREVIDWDEGTFLLMAQDVLRGHLPYTKIYDMKPPGLFLLLAAPLGIFGESLAVARLFGDASIVLTAAATFLAARRYSGSRLAAGLAVLAMVSALSLPFGLYTSSEILAIAPLAWALLLLMTRRRSFGASIAVGALLCLATLIRTNLALVVIAVGLLCLAGAFLPRLGFHRRFVAGYVAGGLGPLAALVLAYWACGALDVLVLGAVTVPRHYSDEMGFVSALRTTRTNASETARAYPLTFGILVGLALLGSLSAVARGIEAARRGVDEAGVDALVLWTGAGAVALSILISGGGYPHYLLQLYPFAAVSAAWAIGLRPLRPVLAGAVLVSVLAAAAATARDTAAVLWDPAAVRASYKVRNAAEAIRADMAPGDRIWTMHEHLVLFYLDRPPITPVATHPDNIVRASILGPLAEAGYSHADELGYILGLRPDYIVNNAYGMPFYIVGENRTRVAAFLEADYDTWYARDGVVVYRRRSKGRPAG